MRHRKRGRILGRKTDQRRALRKSLASSFFMTGRITTTQAKAKELRPYVERTITAARHPDLARRRALESRFPKLIVKKILERAKIVGNRPGGYTRIIHLGARKSDSAPMAILELVK